MCELDDIDKAWDNFCTGNYEEQSGVVLLNNQCDKPKCSSLYISTKTKISFLSSDINLHEVFWKIPTIEYSKQIEGVVKKQMKVNSLNETELQNLQTKITNERNNNNHVDEHIITRIVNPDGRIKFKDVRKISVGLSNKDIISYRCKRKGAFYNCFVLILRLKVNGIFKEVHIKVFNTGKLEIPGIKSDTILTPLLSLLISIISQYCSGKPITYLKDKCETVLINSNFNCGYFIDRDKLFDLLKYKYNIKCAFDPCSYPGIQSVFYYNHSEKEQNGKKLIENKDQKNVTKVSVMIFRTGSVLVVGKSNEETIQYVYEFFKDLLNNEYDNISNGLQTEGKLKVSKKIRKRKIIVSL